MVVVRKGKEGGVDAIERDWIVEHCTCQSCELFSAVPIISSTPQQNTRSNSDLKSVVHGRQSHQSREAQKIEKIQSSTLPDTKE